MYKKIVLLLLLLFIILSKVDAQYSHLQSYKAYFNYKVLQYKLIRLNNSEIAGKFSFLLSDSTTLNINGLKNFAKKDSAFSYINKLCDELVSLDQTMFIYDDPESIKIFFKNVLLNKSYPELYNFPSSVKEVISSDLDKFVDDSTVAQNINNLQIARKISALTMISIISNIILIFILIILFYRNNFIIKYNKKINSNIHSLDNNIEGINLFLKEEVQNNKNSINEIKNSVKDVNSFLSIKNENDENEIKKVMGFENDQKYIDTHSNSTQSEFIKYYLSTPNDDGSFLDRYKSLEFEPSSKYFLFRIPKINLKMAYVSIVDNTDTQKAILNHYKEHLGAVCIYKNSFFKGATKIKTDKEGTAFLEGDKWTIKDNDKLVISFQ